MRERFRFGRGFLASQNPGVPSGSASPILIAALWIIYGLVGMGAKYLPTIKDTKLSQRYRRIKGIRPLPKKSAAVPPAPKNPQK